MSKMDVSIKQNGKISDLAKKIKRGPGGKILEFFK